MNIPTLDNAKLWVFHNGALLMWYWGGYVCGTRFANAYMAEWWADMEGVQIVEEERIL
jgi:hypothetical protein